MWRCSPLRALCKQSSIVDGEAQQVPVDVTGFALVDVPVGAEVSVRSYDGEGLLLGETPLPEPETDFSRLPGEARETRIVD